MGDPGVMEDLGGTDDWDLKGEGNANAVFGYVGPHPPLRGVVLRLDKGKRFLPGEDDDGAVDWSCGDAFAAAVAQLEEEVWAAVPGLASAGGEVQRRAAYVQQVMAPALGDTHVHRHLLVRAPPSFVQGLAARCGSLGARRSCLVALQADHTTLPATVTAAAAASGGAGSQAEGSGAASGARNRSPAGGDFAAGAQSTLRDKAPNGRAVGATEERAWRAESLVAEGPVVCVEIKPKSGALLCPQEGVAAPPGAALKRAHHRYSLHQLLKLSQGKVGGVSGYCPGDLFSGDPLRVRAALCALWRHPQNNLGLFVDGRRVPAPRSSGGEGACNGGGREAGFDGVPAAAAALQALLQGAERVDGSGSGGSGGRPTAALMLASLLQRALAQEEVLPRLLAVQRLDVIGVEGAYALLRRLLWEARGAAALPPSLPPLPGGDVGASEGVASDGSGKQVRGAAASAGGGCSPASEVEEEGEAWAEYRRRLAALRAVPAHEAHSLLRSYLTAMTAKDCGLMVALQRVQGVGEPHSPPTVDGAEPPLPAAGGGGVNASGGGGGERPMQDRGGAGYVREQSSGLLFRYKLAFVDLDVKPLAKLPRHFALDRDVLRHALGVLRDDPLALQPKP